MKKIVIAILIAFSFSGCAITWSGVALAIGTGAVVAEDIGGILKTYKDTKDYIAGEDNNSSE